MYIKFVELQMALSGECTGVAIKHFERLNRVTETPTDNTVTLYTSSNECYTVLCMSQGESTQLFERIVKALQEMDSDVEVTEGPAILRVSPDVADSYYEAAKESWLAIDKATLGITQ